MSYEPIVYEQILNNLLISIATLSFIIVAIAIVKIVPAVKTKDKKAMEKPRLMIATAIGYIIFVIFSQPIGSLVSRILELFSY